MKLEIYCTIDNKSSLSIFNLVFGHFLINELELDIIFMPNKQFTLDFLTITY